MIRQPAPRGQVATIHRYGIALGSNLGDRLAALRNAAQAMKTLADFSVPVLQAPIYESAPVDCPAGSESFLNSVLEISFYGHPRALFEHLKAIERAMGRPVEREKNAPRAIDLDLLYADALTINEPDLQVLHPQLTQRRFVLEPLAHIQPARILPGQSLNVRELLARLPAEPILTEVATSW